MFGEYNMTQYFTHVVVFEQCVSQVMCLLQKRKKMKGPQFNPLNKNVPALYVAKLTDAELLSEVRLALTGVYPINVAAYPQSVKLFDADFPISLDTQIKKDQIKDVTDY